jgi:putative peptide zinc metalloprotease protein
VTAWVLCVVPLLSLAIGYLLAYLPQINRALWRSASMQAHLMTTAAVGHRYAEAAVDAISVGLATLTVAGSVYIVAGLTRRVAGLGVRWSARRPGRQVLAGAAGLSCLAALAAFWITRGQFRGW